MTRRGESADTDRAASEVVGVALLIGIVLVVLTVTVVLGSGLLTDLNDTSEVQSAENSFREIDSRVADSAGADGDIRVLNLPESKTGSTTINQESSYTIEVNGANCIAESSQFSGDDVLLGSLIYEQGNGEKVAYEGGAVWKQSPSGVSTVSPPELGVSDGRIEIALPAVTGSLNGNQASAKTDRSRTRKIQRALNSCWGSDVSDWGWMDPDVDNPSGPDEHLVSITISDSAYLDGWKQYAENNLDATVTSGTTGGVDWVEITFRINYDASQLTSGSGLPDQDSDGVPDGSDNCPTEPNPSQSDIDGDGQGDACDSDTDNDGTDDPSDNCPTVPNAGQADSDNDGLGDACDTDDDGDNDGIKDTNDNCPAVSNNAQTDTDGDGLGDACDPDDDNDGIDDSADNSPLVANPSQTDTDGDGIGDVSDGDDDGDGVADGDDDCQLTAGTGVNGCPSFEVDDTNNGIVVNQESATLTLLGTQVGQIEQGAERLPLDVMFVLDRSGSMGEHEIQQNADGTGVRQVPSSDLDWRVPYEIADDEVCLDDGTRVAVYSEENTGGDGPDGRSFIETRTIPTDCDGSSEAQSIPAGEDWFVPDSISYSYWAGYYGGTVVNSGQTVWLEDDDHYIAHKPGNDPGKLRVDATKSFIDSLDESAGDRAGLVEFWTEAQLINGQGLSNDLDQVKSNVEGSADGGTNINDGIDRGIEEYEQNGGSNERVIVLLSDGKNDPQNPNDQYTIDRAQEAANKDITIYTVGLGDGADEDLLQDVADITGGEYHHVSNADELDETFDQIAGEVTDSRRINNKPVQASLSIGGDTTEFASGSNVNDPDNSVTIDASLDDIDAGSLLTFSTTAYACDTDPVNTGDKKSHNGEEFDVAKCDGGVDSVLDSVSSSTNGDRLHIYTDGESVPTASQPWWQIGLQSTLDPYTNGGAFVLTDHQAIILLEVEGTTASYNYVALLFEADDQTETYTPTPTTDNDYDNDGILDTPDNCWQTPNHDQTDTDGDGTGDACEGTSPPPSSSDDPEEIPIDVEAPEVDVGD